mgnify:CR=1 FL=1
MKFKLIILCLFLCMNLNFINGSEFLYDSMRNGVGIRALSMGGAFTGYALGTDTIFYNPAGLAYPGMQYTYENLDFNNTNYTSFEANTFYLSPLGISLWNKSTASESVNVTAISFGRRTRS